jgi:nitroreductase
LYIYSFDFGAKETLILSPLFQNAETRVTESVITIEIKLLEMNEPFGLIEKVIAGRRTVKPQQMNGGIVPHEDMAAILALADFAPTHGITEPWRFVVYSGVEVIEFCSQHATLYQLNTDPGRFEQGKYDKLLHMGDKASHIVIAIMHRGDLPKIHAWEEKAATACAVQNILLGASAMGIAAYWGSGGMAQHNAMKHFLNLREEDFVMGILYFGYSDKEPPFTRKIPFDEKVRWVK